MVYSSWLDNTGSFIEFGVVKIFVLDIMMCANYNIIIMIYYNYIHCYYLINITDWDVGIVKKKIE
jgi:hypothetical protein